MLNTVLLCLLLSSNFGEMEANIDDDDVFDNNNDSVAAERKTSVGLGAKPKNGLIFTLVSLATKGVIQYFYKKHFMGGLPPQYFWRVGSSPPPLVALPL